MTLPLDTASVRLQLDSATAERMARRVGARIGRRFADGFNNATTGALDDTIRSSASRLDGVGADSGHRFGQRFAARAGDAFDDNFSGRVSAATRRMKPDAVTVPIQAVGGVGSHGTGQVTAAGQRAGA